MRFRDEDGKTFCEWEKKSLSEILSIKHGKDYKNQPSGDIPVLGTGGQIATVGSFLCNWPCVLIGRKGTINKPQYMDVPFWSVDTLFYTKPIKDNDPKFQFYLFQTINWLMYNEASGVPSLSASAIEKIEKFVPCYKEQNKLSLFFSELDKRINLAEKKLAALEMLKAGLMQKIFGRELRFKREGGDKFQNWGKVKVGDIAELITGFPFESSKFSENGVSLVKGANVKRGVITFDEGNHSFWKSERGYEKYLLQVDDLLIQMDGALVGKSFGFVTEEILPALLVQRVTRIRCSDKALMTILYNSLQDGVFYKYIKNRLTNTAVPHISLNDIKNFEFYVPEDTEEKLKVSNLILYFNKKISLEKHKVKNLRLLKKAFLQQMFV